MTDLANRRTALYRLYDAHERLLYVGITHKPVARWKGHSKTKSWWPQVAVRQVEWVEDRHLAEEAERVAIRRERPIYNVRDVAWPSPKSSTVEADHRELPFHEWLRHRAILAGYDLTVSGAQAALARDAGISRAQTCRMLAGANTPDVPTLRALARTLRLPLIDLLVRSGLAIYEDFEGEGPRGRDDPYATARLLGVPAARQEEFVAMIAALADVMRRSA